MKKRLLIICSIIGVLLAGFKFPIYAEETTPDYSSSTSIITSASLDQYFYDNYDLLLYIESDGTQYINTSVVPSNNLLIKSSFSSLADNSNKYLFGSRISFGNNALGVAYSLNSGNVSLYFDSSNSSYSANFNQYSTYNLTFDRNIVYFNNGLIHEFENDEIINDYPIYIFGLNSSGEIINTCKSKLFRFSIYDYAAKDGEGALIRDYYPARSKSSGVVGLYDAVSKTFVTTSGSVPFENPTDDSVDFSMGAYISQFLSGSLSWVGAIFEGINEMPIIWVFIAIALAGVMFRWARRIVHF